MAGVREFIITKSTRGRHLHEAFPVEHVAFLESVASLDHPDWLSSKVAPPSCTSVSSGAIFRSNNGRVYANIIPTLSGANFTSL